MAHKKAAGSTRLGRDSRSQRLGVKIFGGQMVNAGGIIIRQRGAKYHAGDNVGKGGDDTLFALKTGTVKFQQKRVVTFDSNKAQRMFVHVVENQELKNLSTKELKSTSTSLSAGSKIKEPKNIETKPTEKAVVEKKETKAPATKKIVKPVAKK